MNDRPMWMRCKTLFAAGLGVIAVLWLSARAVRGIVDFPVYYDGARAILAGSRVLYGPGSGLPMPYRYPPLFLLLFLPFALLSFKSAAILWAAAKCGIAYLLARALLLRLHVEGRVARILAALPAIPYLALEMHYGNAQFYVFALVALALLWLEEHPLPAALALALGISIKAWPLFFVPYCLALGCRRVVRWALVMTLGLTLLPAAFFGVRGYGRLLGEWGTQELGVASAAGEPDIITFPSQSLHSMMMRYLVSLDYTKLADRRYPKFNLADFDARAVELAWFALAAAGYGGFLLFVYQRREADRLVLHALAFCGYLLLQPFTQSTDLVVLLWPVVAAASLVRRAQGLAGWAQAALWTAMSLMVIKPLVPGAPVHRFLEVLGADFMLVAALTAGLAAGAGRGAPDAARGNLTCPTYHHEAESSP